MKTKDSVYETTRRRHDEEELRRAVERFEESKLLPGARRELRAPVRDIAAALVARRLQRIG